MSRSPARPPGAPNDPGGGRARWPFALGGAVVVILLAFAYVAFEMSGASLAVDGTALAVVNTQAFGGSIEQVHVTGPGGKSIPVSTRDGRLVPKGKLNPGERVTVEVTTKRPGWVGWLAGDEGHDELTLRAPLARVTARWLTVEQGETPRVRFDQPIRSIAYGLAGRLKRRDLTGMKSSVGLGSKQVAGTMVVRNAPRSWERMGRSQPVTWFPAGNSPAVVASPAPGADVSPATPLRLTFSKPVSDAIGSKRPSLDPDVPGHWSQADSHTLVFKPSGYGAGFGTTIHAQLPKRLNVVTSNGGQHGGRGIEWSVPAGSTLRLQQLLAQAGYMPLNWKTDKRAVKHDPSDEVRAAIDPPSGSFSWRYPNTPDTLKALWSAGGENTITQGAVMAYQEDHGLETDGVAGQDVWHSLLVDAIAGKRKPDPGYSYVYVTRGSPESATVWHNGKTVVSSPANTGIASAPTDPGTFPVFEHIPSGTMSGTNPDGSHYNDPGIQWISYFNGGDALHAFDRASFGTPQSLGCVELPLDAAAQIWPYTPIGTLVTIE